MAWQGKANHSHLTFQHWSMMLMYLAKKLKIPRLFLNAPKPNLFQGTWKVLSRYIKILRLFLNLRTGYQSCWTMIKFNWRIKRRQDWCLTYLSKWQKNQRMSKANGIKSRYSKVVQQFLNISTAYQPRFEQRIKHHSSWRMTRSQDRAIQEPDSLIYDLHRKMVFARGLSWHSSPCLPSEVEAYQSILRVRTSTSDIWAVNPRFYKDSG